MKTLGKILALAALGTAGTLIKGFILMKLWAWFIVPQFLVSPLSFVTALGVSLLVGFLTYQPNFTKDTDDPNTKERIAALVGLYFLAYPLILLSGWVISLFL